jgi:hypothetical protein
MFRNFSSVLVLLALASIGAGYASGNTLSFVDLSALSPLNYYQAYACGINTSGVVTLQGQSSAVHGSGQYYHTFLYTGGTAATLSDITSHFTTYTYSDAMNGSGQMAAAGFGSASALFYSGGTSGTTTKYQYNTYNTFGVAVDAVGDEGGWYSNSHYYPMVYTGGSAYGLNTPPGDSYNTSTAGAGIVALNTSGQGVGFSSPSTGGGPPDINAAVWTYTISGESVTSQTATNIESLVVAQYPTAQRSEFLAINSSGEAVGAWNTTGSGSLTSPSNAFMYNVGTPAFTSLGGLLTYSPIAQSLSYGAGQSQMINDSGAVVGCVPNSGNSFGYDAAIWQNGTVTDLNAIYGPTGLNILPSGFVLNDATAIDDNGDIAGYGTDGSGHTVQAWVIYAAVPEPGMLALIGSGLVGLLGYAWRKRK